MTSWSIRHKISKSTRVRDETKEFIARISAYVLNISSASILPTEVHKWIFTLVNVHHSLSFIRRDSSAFHSHFSSAEFDEIFRRRSARMAEETARHLEDLTQSDSTDRWLPREGD